MKETKLFLAEESKQRVISPKLKIQSLSPTYSKIHVGRPWLPGMKIDEFKFWILVVDMHWYWRELALRPRGGKQNHIASSQIKTVM